MQNRRRLVLSLAVLFAVNIAVITFFQSAEAAVYRQGSTGDAVRTIQTKLSNWGYFSGAIDGIYGPKTEEAVKYFQRKNGLTADGIVGPATLRALGMSTTGGDSPPPASPTAWTCWPGLSRQRPEANHTADRWRWERLFSTGWSTPPSLTLSPGWYISRALSPAW